MTYTIADMCKAGRTTLRGVRWWEKQGLLPGVERGKNNYRSYSVEHIRRARIIAACQLCGMKLNEIEAMLANYNRSEIVEKLTDLQAEARAIQAALPTGEPELDL